VASAVCKAFCATHSTPAARTIKISKSDALWRRRRRRRRRRRIYSNSMIL